MLNIYEITLIVACDLVDCIIVNFPIYTQMLRVPYFNPHFYLCVCKKWIFGFLSIFTIKNLRHFGASDKYKS